MQLVVPLTERGQETTQGNTGIINGGERVLAYEADIPALPTQEEVWSFTRFHIEVPCWLGEREFEKAPEGVNETETEYKTETEASAVAQGEGGAAHADLSIEPISVNAPFESVETKVAYTVIGKRLLTSLRTNKARSVLPVTAQLIVQLVGTEGIMWSSLLDVPFHYVAGLAGSAEGGALLDVYTDLQNPISLISGQPLKLRLYWYVPTNVKVRPLMGVAFSKLAAVERAGAFTLFYTSQPRANYPVGR